MTSDPAAAQEQVPRPFDAALGSFGRPDSIVRQFDFWDDRYEGRRLFSEALIRMRAHAFSERRVLADVASKVASQLRFGKDTD